MFSSGIELEHWSQLDKIDNFFYISKAFFQLSLDVAPFLHELSFKCCLGVL